MGFRPTIGAVYEGRLIDIVICKNYTCGGLLMAAFETYADNRDCKTALEFRRKKVDWLCEKYPKAKILLMTNYNRWPSKNKLGFSDIDYVEAMERVCRRYALPCFNNYYNSGISFQNPAQLAWIDEGVVRGDAPNHHFSSEAYAWLMPKYEALLAAL